MLSRLSQNYLIIQVWRKDQLVGIAKVFFQNFTLKFFFRRFRYFLTVEYPILRYYTEFGKNSSKNNVLTTFWENGGQHVILDLPFT